jgi:hypothetical protein
MRETQEESWRLHKFNVRVVDRLWEQKHLRQIQHLGSFFYAVESMGSVSELWTGGAPLRYRHTV